MTTNDPHHAHGKFTFEPATHTVTAPLYEAVYADYERALVSRWSRKPYVVMGACGMHGALEVGGLAAVIGGLDGPRFREWRRELKGAGGVSIGSFITTLIALGMDLKCILDVYTSFPFEAIFKDDAAAALSSITGIESLGKVSGIMTGASLRTAVYAAFKVLGVRIDITFEELAAAATSTDDEPFDLRILAADLLHLRPTVFSAANTPKVPIIDAVVASMSIPGMFRPVTLSGYGTFVDGGIIDPFGLDIFPDRAGQVLHILKLNNIDHSNRAMTLPQVLTTCLSTKAHYDLGRHPKLVRLDVLPQFAGSNDAIDETLLQNPFHVFDVPDVTGLVLDGCASVESSVLLLCVLALVLAHHTTSTASAAYPYPPALHRRLPAARAH
jgi:predicted acylesterase/phospholipase RssA